MQRSDIEEVVGRAIQDVILAKTDVTKFTWTIVPSKSLLQDGAGLGWNAWHHVLHDLVADHLPKRRPYTALTVGPLLVRDSFNKNLRSLRYALTERLIAIDAIGFKPL